MVTGYLFVSVLSVGRWSVDLGPSKLKAGSFKWSNQIAFRYSRNILVKRFM